MTVESNILYICKVNIEPQSITVILKHLANNSAFTSLG